MTNCQVRYLQLSNYLSTFSLPVYIVFLRNFLRVYIVFLRDKVDFSPAQRKKSGNDEKKLVLKENSPTALKQFFSVSRHTERCALASC